MEEKKLSEFLKENNAYGSFVEYSVESFLKCLDWYKVFKSENNTIGLGNIFIWEDTKEGQNYWRNLKSNLPKPIEYDMNEIVFAEVERRDKMKNKVICDVCKGTKLYQVSNLEFEDCTKCKGKGYIINIDKTLERESMEDFKDLKISKELLSEVLGISTILMNPIIESENKIGYLVYGSQNTLEEVRRNHKQINIYEFAFKCKGWALTKGYFIYSTNELSFIKTFSLETIETFSNGKDTEIECILKACEWLLNEVSK